MLATGWRSLRVLWNIEGEDEKRERSEKDNDVQ
jgi:hypothetical protein